MPEWPGKEYVVMNPDKGSFIYALQVELRDNGQVSITSIPRTRAGMADQEKAFPGSTKAMYGNRPEVAEYFSMLHDDHRALGVHLFQGGDRAQMNVMLERLRNGDHISSDAAVRNAVCDTLDHFLAGQEKFHADDMRLKTLAEKVRDPSGICPPAQ